MPSNAIARKITPSHSNKRGVRHRYHVSRRLIEGTASKSSTSSTKDGWRLRARPLGEAIARIISERLTSSDFAKLTIQNLTLAESSKRIERTKELVEAITTKLAKVAALTKSVRIEPGQITIAPDPNQIVKKLKRSQLTVGNHYDDHDPHIEGHTDDNPQDDLSIIKAPFQLCKRGVETKLIIGGLNSELDQVLIRNIVRAYQWHQAIKQGTTFDQIK